MKIIGIKKIYGDYIITLQIFSENYTCEFIRDSYDLWWMIVHPERISARTSAVNKEWTEKLEKLFQEYRSVK